MGQDSGGRFGEALQRLDWSRLPVFVGLALIWVVFSALSPNFLTALNLSNLFLQIAAGGTLAVGVVLVLLLGEIDLSLGVVGGLSAAVTAVLCVKHGLPGAWAGLLGIAGGALVGLVQGAWISRSGVPSFVVTLAGQLLWQGALLFVLGETGSLNLRDPFLLGLAGAFIPAGAAWTLGGAALLAFAGLRFRARRRRARHGLPLEPAPLFAGRILAVAALALLGLAVFGADRGVPLAVLVFFAVMAVVDLVLRRTRFGRCVFAVGGNPESARRAGIGVAGVKMAVFSLASGLAALGGLMGASRLMAVNQSSGGGETLLNAIAAAVIGGTSLFGGRGSAWSALTGYLVIGSISNGMDLLALPSSIKYMITGGVLLLAVTADAFFRRGGRAPKA